MQDELTQVIIREATKNDLGQIINLLIDDKLGKTREVVSNSTNEIDKCYIDAYTHMLVNPSQQILVMELNTEIIGVLELTYIHSLTHKGSLRANIEGVRIKSNYRNQGLGSKLFKYVERLAIDKGCAIIQLTTNLQRLDAKHFYEKLGFVASHYGMKMEL